MEEKEKTIHQMLDDMAKEICEHHCKYPDIWDEEEKGLTMIDAVCPDCPLCKML